MSDAASEHDALRRRLIASLRDVSDFPKPGITFKDITPVLADPALLRDVVSAMAAPWEESGVTHVAGVESRGFMFATPVAIALGAGFIPIRKPGKLPSKTAGIAYALEYGTDRLEMHVDAFSSPARVLLVDDVLATGGTASAACELIEKVNGSVLGCGFLLSVAGLCGAHRLSHRRVVSLLEC